MLQGLILVLLNSLSGFRCSVVGRSQKHFRIPHTYRELNSFLLECLMGSIGGLQQSPTFLASGTSFLEDSFSTGWGVGDGFRMIQGQYIQAHLLLWGTVPNRPGPVPVLGGRLGAPELQHLEKLPSSYFPILPNLQ